MSVIPSEARAPDDSTSKREAAGQAAEAAGQAASNVAGTAKDQARRVTEEASAQARNVASDVKGRVTEQARTQNDKLVDGIRRMADELDQMKSDRTEGPAAAVVTRVADGGRQVADYLANNGPDGVLREVQEFARRRPGAFLATALVSGFVVGRLGKGVLNAADASSTTGKPQTDTFVSTTPGYAAGTTQTNADYVAYTPNETYSSTEYAATGTGTPLAVNDPYDDAPSTLTTPDPRYDTDPTFGTEPGYEGRPR
jgi:hypothetical protein